MQKLEPLLPEKTFKIIQHGNGDEPIFFEPENRIYFQSLIEKHLLPICEIVSCQLSRNRIEIILKFRTEAEIPEKFKGKLYLPLSNTFNSYAKSINKRYDRKGSLFKRRFDRIEIF